MEEDRLVCRAGHIPAWGLLFSLSTGGQGHLLRGGATLAELGRHLRRRPRFKVVFTERWRGSHPLKGCGLQGQCWSPAEVRCAKSKLQPATGMTSPRSSPGPGRELAQSWVCPRWGLCSRHHGQMSPFASTLSGFVLLCSYKCTFSPGSKPALGSLGTRCAYGTGWIMYPPGKRLLCSNHSSELGALSKGLRICPQSE